MNDKLLSLLGLCRRAGRLRSGFEQTVIAVTDGKAELVLVAADAAARTEKEVRFKAGDSVPVLRIPADKAALSHAIGTVAGTVAVLDAGFARQAILLIQQGGNIV